MEYLEGRTGSDVPPAFEDEYGFAYRRVAKRRVTITRLLPWLMILWLVGSGVFFMVLRPLLAQQSQDAINAQTSGAIQTLQDEVESLRQQRIDARLSILEDTVVEVKWLGRTVAGVLIGQLVLGMQAIRKRRE